MILGKVILLIVFNNLVIARPEWEWIPFPGDTTPEPGKTDKPTQPDTDLTTEPAPPTPDVTMNPKRPKKVKFEGHFNISGKLNIHVMDPGSTQSPNVTTDQPGTTGSDDHSGMTDEPGTTGSDEPITGITDEPGTSGSDEPITGTTDEPGTSDSDDHSGMTDAPGPTGPTESPSGTDEEDDDDEDDQQPNLDKWWE